MKHVHKYEPISHHGINPELMKLGLQSAEVRKCPKCQKEMIFVSTKKGDWFPVLDDRESEEQDILLA